MKITRRQLKRIILESVNMINEKRVTPYMFTGDESDVSTGEVEFNYGRYTGRLKDLPYWMMQDADGLGSVQRRGDPYTYERVGSDRLRIISGPAKSYQDAEIWAGAVIKDPNARDQETNTRVQSSASNSPESAPIRRTEPSIEIIRSAPGTPRTRSYTATAEQVATLAEQLAGQNSLERTVRDAYLTFAKELRETPPSSDKDRVLDTILKAPGVPRETVLKLAQGVGIRFQ